MAKAEGEAADPFLPKLEPQSSHAPAAAAAAKEELYEQPPYLEVGAPFRRPGAVHSNITVCCVFYHANLIILVVLLFLIAVGLVLWPSQPEIQVIHVQLHHGANISSSSKGVGVGVGVGVGGGGGRDDTSKIVFLDASMDVRLRVQNQDFVPHNYNIISIVIGYHGRRLGSTTRNATFVNARSMAYVDATIKLAAIQADPDGVAEGARIPLEIVAQVGSKFHFFSINIPVQGRISCSVDVDVATQTIAGQNCYPE